MAKMRSPATIHAMILEVLLQDGATYGMGLINNVSKRTRGKVALKKGSIYPALKSLEGKGLIQAQQPASEFEYAEKYYVLTDNGREAALAHRELLRRIFKLVA